MKVRYDVEKNKFEVEGINFLLPFEQTIDALLVLKNEGFDDYIQPINFGWDDVKREAGTGRDFSGVLSLLQMQIMKEMKKELEEYEELERELRSKLELAEIDYQEFQRQQEIEAEAMTLGEYL